MCNGIWHYLGVLLNHQSKIAAVEILCQKYQLGIATSNIKLNEMSKRGPV